MSENITPRGVLAKLYLRAAVYGSIIENTIQPANVSHFVETGQQLIPESLGNLLNHLGDVSNGFLALPALFLLHRVVEAVDPERTNNMLRNTERGIQFFLVTLLAAWIVDAESIRIFPFSDKSVPDLLDIPAGLFGILAGVLYYEHIKNKGLDR